jgi:2-C-methyl-D-erythritol 4-phosphate cytidylyltransferase
MGSIAVLIPAAGRSTRYADKEKKPFATLDGRAVWLRSAELFVNRSDVAECLIMIAPEDDERFRTRYAANLAFMNVKLVPGGRERFDSIANGLARISAGVEMVAIHDAVRPCVTAEQIDAVFAAARQHGAAILAARLADTLKRVEGQFIKETPSREGLWLAQTPQVFRRDILEAAYARRGAAAEAITDDAQLVEALGLNVAVVEGTASNIKITSKDDLALAAAILKSRPAPKEKRPIHPFADEEMWR